jgi:folate-binding protein YgfZ
MKPGWREFLKDAGAEFDDCDTVTHFGNPERELRVVTTGMTLCDLSHQGLISAYGDDTETFLQGQLSNDVREVSETHSQLSSYCTPKGRMLAILRLFKREETYYLRLPEALVEPVLKRMRMFVLRSQVTLEDATDALVRIGLSGPESDSELRTILGAIPEQPDDVLQHDDLTVLRVPGPHPRFEIAGELDAVENMWDRLNVRAAPVGASGWALLDILAGVPSVHAQTVEAFVPQMANMELVGGLSFKKGCYPGQEVVARSQYLGKLKRRMYLGRLETDTPPNPGDDVYDAHDESGQSAGKIVDAQPHPDGGYAALAVLQIASAETGDLRLGQGDGPVCTLETMPYPVPEKNERQA